MAAPVVRAQAVAQDQAPHQVKELAVAPAPALAVVDLIQALELAAAQVIAEAQALVAGRAQELAPVQVAATSPGPAGRIPSRAFRKPIFKVC
jgi:hypothetical protein